jgi:predicted membrane protein (TIGR00267 family)
MIVGASVATWNSNLILIVGLTGGLADAFGNSIGFYLSELSERGSQIHERNHGGNFSVHSLHEILMSGVLSFAATIVVMILLLIPFLFLDIFTSLITASVEAVVVMSMLGFYVGKICDESPVKMALRYVTLAVMGAAFSYVVGELLRIWLISTMAIQ